MRREEPRCLKLRRGREVRVRDAVRALHVVCELHVVGGTSCDARHGQLKRAHRVERVGSGRAHTHMHAVRARFLGRGLRGNPGAGTRRDELLGE